MFKEIIFLCSLANTGDMKHADAVFDALPSHETVQRYQIDANETCENTADKMEELFQKYASSANDSPYIIYAVGDKGRDCLRILNDRHLISPDKAYVVAGTHQYSPDYELIYITEADGRQQTLIRHMCLPGAMPEDTKERIKAAYTNHTFTFAVPTKNPSIEELEQSYHVWDSASKPRIEDDYIIVTLPGDAPDSTNKQRLFTKQSAQQLVDFILCFRTERGNRHTIIVQNSPRTGKFDEAGNIMCPHEYEKGHRTANDVTDAVSLFFIDRLRQNGIEPHFYNFAFEKDGAAKKVISVYNPLLYVAQTPGRNNYYILPGESVSMLGQIPLYMTGDRIIVFKPDSMNDQHDLIFQMIQRHQYLSVFNEHGNVVQAEPGHKRLHDDARDVATAISDGFGRWVGSITSTTA